MRRGAVRNVMAGAALTGAVAALGLTLPRLATADATLPPPPVSTPEIAPRPPPSPVPEAARSAAVPEYPDLTQSDPALGLPEGGSSYCGPVAVSNALMWLAQGGYPRLAPPASSLRERQLALVRALGTQRYMATSPTLGTGTFRLLEGLHRWVRDAGYEVERLEYQGWHGHPIAYSTHVKEPRLPWLAAALARGGVAVLHVGWYVPPTRWEPAYRRHGGHWVTVERVLDDGRVELRDPAPYAGDSPALERVRTRIIERGWLLDGTARLRADGHLELTEGMHVKRPGEVALVDGAVILVLASAPTR